MPYDMIFENVLYVRHSGLSIMILILIIIIPATGVKPLPLAESSPDRAFPGQPTVSSEFCS